MKKLIMLLTLMIALMIPMDDSVYAKHKNKKLKKKYEYIGVFELTAYCDCPRCCGKWAGGKNASGKKSKPGVTVAVDTSIIPLGTKLLINGHKYIAQDTGGGIKGHKIDVFFGSHSECIKFGRQRAKVYKRKPPVLVGKLKRRKILWKKLKK